MDTKFISKLGDAKQVLEIAALLVGGVEGGFRLKGFVQEKMAKNEQASAPAKMSWKEKRAAKKAAKADA